MGVRETAGKFLGGSIILKIILLIGVLFIGWAALNALSGKITIGSLVLDSLKIVFGIGLITLMFWGLQSKFTKAAIPSPNEDVRESIIKLAIRRKPFSIKKLVLRGEDMLTFITWFKRIDGIMFLPYFQPKQKTNSVGEPQLKPLTDYKGRKVLDKEKKPVMVPDYELLTEKDGEWIIVGSPEPVWKFWKRKLEIVRSHYSLVSGIGETIFIKTVNLCPFNGYYYPNQQWQDDIIRVITQNKNEALLETYKELVNLPAQFAQLALQDPTFKKWMEAKNENIASQNMAPLVR